MDWIVSHWDEIAEVAAAILVLASIITRLTPTPKDDAIVARLVAGVSFLDHGDSGRATKIPGLPGTTRRRDNDEASGE